MLLPPVPPLPSTVPSTKVNFQPPIADPRTEHRTRLFQELFSWTFTWQRTAAAAEQASPAIRQIIALLPEIDAQLLTVAHERPLADINKVDLAILRVGLFEAKTSDTPKRVIVDEAIELAKLYGSDQSSKFINATLASLLLDTPKIPASSESAT